MAHVRSLLARVRSHPWRNSHPSGTTLLHDEGSWRSTSVRYSIQLNVPASPVFHRGTDRLPASAPQGLRFPFIRYLSTQVGDGVVDGEIFSDVAGVVSDKTTDVMASQEPVFSEVAVAAADSYPPVAALQYFIDGVHSFTGFNWWASIALTTLLIRGATIPLLINLLKATSKLSLMRPRLEAIKQEIQNADMDPSAVAEGHKKMQALFKEYGVHPLSPLKGLFIQGPVFISFYLAISNMVEKVPSFKTGGAFWFTDLTTPDTFYIFPILTGMSFLVTVELNTQEGLEGNPVAGTMKTISRIFAFATVFFTSAFPKAIFCYWITSNFFSLAYGLVIKRPNVKKFLGIPEIKPPPPSTNAFSWSTLLGRDGGGGGGGGTGASSPQPRVLNGRAVSSSSLLSQRLKTLEKQVKGRKKNKKK